MSIVTKRALVVAPLLLLGLAACGTSTIAADEVSAEAVSALEAKYEGTLEVECPDELVAEVGEEITCTLTNADTDEVFDMTATVSSVEDGEANLEFLVVGEK
jgi:hypothetical protein